VKDLNSGKRVRSVAYVLGRLSEGAHEAAAHPRLRGKVMPNKHEQFSIAVLDDYQGVALSMADWSVLVEGRVSVTVFNDHIADIDPSSRVYCLSISFA